MSALEVENLEVIFATAGGAVNALHSFSLNVAPGGLTILLGESGCGKSTALNSLAGLIDPSSGQICLGGTTLFEKRGRRATVNLPPDRRDIGMVFQSYALWPHLSVRENVMYPLRRRGVPAAEADQRADHVLATVRCATLADRHPGELSGGQQQRVALARALVARPKLLLFDEPLSNLDAGLRRGLRDELARLHREIGFTGVYVTHDQAEALSLGTDVAVMRAGRVVQSGAPNQIYEHPATEYVARFLGANAVGGRVVGSEGQLTLIDTPAGRFQAAQVRPDTELVSVAFMPQAAEVELVPDGPLAVVNALYLGSHRELRLAAPDCEILIIQPVSKPAPAIGDKARLRIRPESVFIYPRSI